MARVSKANIGEFQVKILLWYEANGRVFPWRGPGLGSYQLIITEVLLQRTKAETVNIFYHKFFTRFPNWDVISRTSKGQLARFLKPIGLFNQRAVRLKNLAIEMTQRKGQIPEDRGEMYEMPFIGQYIGNAIELLIHKRPRPLLDVNMARVLERYFVERKMADIRYDAGLQQLAHKIVFHERSKEISWAVLDFAATICTAQNPKCNVCILRVKCTYYKSA